MDIGIKLSDIVCKDIVESNPDLPQDLAKELSRFESSPSLSTIIKFARWKCYKSKEPGLHKVLQNAVLQFPTPVKEPRNKELEARISKLKERENQRLYNKMVSNVAKPRDKEKLKRKAPITSGLNFAVTMVATVFATAYVLRYIVPDYTLRIAIGLVVGTFIMLIEIFLAVRAIQKEEEELTK